MVCALKSPRPRWRGR